MKKIVASSIVVIILCILLCACTVNERYSFGGGKPYKIELKAYPSKIIYIQNEDQYLDISGLEYWTYDKNNGKTLYSVSSGIIDYETDEVSADIDFSKEGVYGVTIFCPYPSKEPIDTIEYTIQVISREHLNEMLNKKQ